MKVTLRKIPNSRTSRGYAVVQVPGFRTVSEHDKLTRAREKAKSLAMKNKTKSYLIRADVEEVYYKR